MSSQGKKKKILALIGGFTGFMILNQGAAAIQQYLVYQNNLVIYTGPGTQIIFDDGTTQVRKRMVVGVPNILYTDITITLTGFAGVEDIDWKPLDPVRGLPNQGSLLADFRCGVRGGCFRIDFPLTLTKWAGAEGVDWENPETNCGPSVHPIYRDGVRDAAYVLDQALIANPASPGVMDVDWKNLVTNGLP